MKSFRTYTIEPQHAGLTVEQYLRQVLGTSGRSLQKLTRAKGLYLNGQPAYLRRPLKAGHTLRVLSLGDEGYGVEPQPGSVEILYEDAAVIVLNKPAGLLVHPAGQTTGGTLANLLAHHWQQAGILATIRAIHRLDRDTSGCVVFAKSARSQALLEEQLKSRHLHRVYWALAAGAVAPAAGVIDAPIGPAPGQPNRRAVTAAGEPAVTRYRTLRTLGGATLLELALETGRTHQIRVHLAHLGYPLLGDGMYGKRSPAIARQALHASSVTFQSIASQSEILVKAPLPADFLQAIAYFEKQ